VNKFLEEPQHSLKFVCEDFANKLCLDPNQAVEPGVGGQENDYLKLFLDAHSRFYVVVCELHCVAPGFPSVDRGQVCEAGFVVHKWVSNIPLASQVNITQAVKAKRKLNSELLRFTETQRKAKKQLDVKTETPKGVVVKSLVEVREKKIVQLQEKLTLSLTS
jgi:hypothetical protein